AGAGARDGGRQSAADRDSAGPGGRVARGAEREPRRARPGARRAGGAVRMSDARAKVGAGRRASVNEAMAGTRAAGPDVDGREGPRDECGVFGLYAPGHEVARLSYFALYALQHRGQESAGIAAADRGGHIITRRELGLVSQVF